jgi:FAD/FMN-containing dehydrogenase
MSTDPSFPRLAEVAADGAGVVVQVGNTGPVVVGVPGHSDVLLSTTRLNRARPVDPVSSTAVAAGGVTLAAVQDFRPHGLELPDPTARTAEIVARCSPPVRESPTPLQGSGRTPPHFFYGHLGYCTVHPNRLDADLRDEALDEAAPRLAAEHDGSISAEHDMGRALDPDVRLPVDGARGPV